MRLYFPNFFSQFFLPAILLLFAPTIVHGQLATSTIPVTPIPLFLNLIDIAAVFIVAGAMVTALFGFVRGFTVSGDHEKEHHDSQLLMKSLLLILLVITLWGVLNYAVSWFGFSREIIDTPLQNSQNP